MKTLYQITNFIIAYRLYIVGHGYILYIYQLMENLNMGNYFFPLQRMNEHLVGL